MSEWRSGGERLWGWVRRLFKNDVIDERDAHAYTGLVLLSAAGGWQFGPPAVIAVLGAGLLYMGLRR
jgi:hypothetical protein